MMKTTSRSGFFKKKMHPKQNNDVELTPVSQLRTRNNNETDKLLSGHHLEGD